MNTTIYDLLVQLIGEPITEYGQYVVYVLATALTGFVLFMLLNMILTLFRWLWGQM